MGEGGIISTIQNPSAKVFVDPALASLTQKDPLTDVLFPLVG
jgi:hypothetical protein